MCHFPSKAAAWRACSKLNKIWKSSLLKSFKLLLFNATVEFVLLYGCEAWTITPKLAMQLDGCYTRKLRAVFNIHWKQHITNAELYGNLPKITQKIRNKRTGFAGHCSRSVECVSKLIHWTPKHGTKKRERPALNYIDVITRDTGLDVNNVRTAMQNRKVWRAIVDRGHHLD